ncbi:carbohydrate deacetylase isoform X2 [Ornithorhynchus anatinus]|uniref:Carbohydrate deacetylase n=2 Tax=Ornithorhynchus anatinus TaxID=9258 RepID=A0A6I8NMC7_ORNAN|nr:carbohydrate deacetylase isoform X2 [Ornithorhynchus anatinus]XP_028904889.1 carbohydrate deacetylase isoform X2 [Ornithorhynchus anatinus]XP_028904892.1 carbohydrate deacetylase isoform X2 [Ornithorhynchus anatinus]XP_039770976.1 carbohydrate deacetylase isoform X2 [Ornithorhynchus anatinus]XP_039770977.1 carbohydrate deacetylase isoform X2 [Ornithorhynchus anatinus]
MEEPRVKLVVTADDFGYCPRRNGGIVEAFLDGAVTSASLLVNGSAAVDAARLAQRHGIPTGLHLNLTEGSSVSGAVGPGSSLRAAGGFLPGKLGLRQALQRGHLDLAEVKLELEAQLALFRDLLGRDPLHVDGHQHVHVLPGVRRVFAQVLESHGIQFTRVPAEPGLARCDWLEPPLLDFYEGVGADGRAAAGEFAQHGIRWPDAFFGLSTMGKHMSVGRLGAALERAVGSVPDRGSSGAVTVELMTHPGHPSVPPAGGCGQGPDRFSQSWERLHELRTLLAPELRDHFRDTGVRLCAFSDL